MVEGAPLLREYTGNGIEGSNPFVSARILINPMPLASGFLLFFDLKQWVMKSAQLTHLTKGCRSRNISRNKSRNIYPARYAWRQRMDDWGLRPRHNRSPSRAERATNVMVTVFCVIVGTFNTLGFASALLNLLDWLT